MKFKYFISDMDGVLLDTERLILKMYQKSARTHGFSFSEEDFLKTIGKNNSDTRAILEKVIPIDFDTFYNTRETYLIDYIETKGIPVKAGVREGLDKIKNAGIRMALATSTDKAKAQYRIKTANIISYFEASAFGDEIKNGKPSPDIFLLAAQRLGVSPQDCFVFEDSPAGVAAAKSAGMHVVLIPDMLAPTNEQKKLADYVANDFLEAVDYIFA